MSIELRELSLKGVDGLSTGSLMALEDAVERAQAEGDWGDDIPLFAHELSRQLYCDPAHEMLFRRLRSLICQRYRAELVARSTSVPVVQIPVSDIPEEDDCQAMGVSGMTAWISGLRNYPRVGPAPQVEEGPYFEDFIRSA